MTATLVPNADRPLPEATTLASSEEVASVRGALLVAAIAAPVVLLVTAIAHAPAVRADAELAGLLSLLGLGVALPAYLALGFALFAHVRARSAAHRLAGPDVAVLAVSAIALVGSVCATIAGSDATFYDVGCVALAVTTAGRLIEGTSRGLSVPVAAALAAASFAVAVRRPEGVPLGVILVGCVAAATLVGGAARARGARLALAAAATVAVVLVAAASGAASLAG